MNNTKFLPAPHESRAKASSTTYRGVNLCGARVVYAWPKKSERYKKVERFFDNFAEFRKAPRHKKWKEIKLATKLPGWTRFKPAEDWLSQNRLRRLIT